MSRQYNIQDRTRSRVEKINTRLKNKRDYNRRVYGFDLYEKIPMRKPDDFKSPKDTQKYLRDVEKALAKQYTQTNKGAILERKNAREYQKVIQGANKRKAEAKERVKNIPTQQKGIPLGGTVGQIMELSGRSRFRGLKELSDSLDRFTSDKDLKKALQEVKAKFSGDFIKRENRRYKKSFIKSLETAFGTLSKPMQRYIKRMPLDDFMNVYYATGGRIDINFVYDDNVKDRLSTLHDTFGFEPPRKWQNLFTLEKQLQKRKAKK